MQSIALARCPAKCLVKAFIDQFRTVTDIKETSDQLMYWPTASVAVDANDPYKGKTVSPLL
jgi:hypothetical protein